MMIVAVLVILGIVVYMWMNDRNSTDISIDVDGLGMRAVPAQVALV